MVQKTHSSFNHVLLRLLNNDKVTLVHQVLHCEIKQIFDRSFINNDFCLFNFWSNMLFLPQLWHLGRKVLLYNTSLREYNIFAYLIFIYLSKTHPSVHNQRIEHSIIYLHSFSVCRRVEKFLVSNLDS